MASDELSEDYKLAEHHLGVMWHEYEDPPSGYIVQGVIIIDGNKYGHEELAYVRNAKNYSVVSAKQRVIDRLMKAKIEQQKEGA